MALSKCIGIISYLPDDSNIRKERSNKLEKLIMSCDRLFHLPIIIIAQNWKDFNINKNNVVIYNYKKLGITGARKELRKKFLESNYDYLIMLDDDIELSGNSGEKYLAQIDNNPNCFIENTKSRLQLFAISKDIFSKEDFLDVDPEKGEGFEDRIFFYTLCKKYPEAHKKFIDTGVEESANATKDSLSTWYHGQDLNDMLKKTELLLK